MLQPRQSHCTAEAVGARSEVSAVGKTEVVLAKSAPPATCVGAGELSALCGKWLPGWDSNLDLEKKNMPFSLNDSLDSFLLKIP